MKQIHPRESVASSTANFGYGHAAPQRLSDSEVWPADDFFWGALIWADALLLCMLLSHNFC